MITLNIFIHIISEIFEKYMNENIQSDHGYVCSSGKHKMCTWVNEESWGMMKTCFTNANQIKIPQNRFMQGMYICSKI